MSKHKEIIEVHSLLNIVVNAMQTTNVIILKKGELENYYSQSITNFFDINDKRKPELFQEELSLLLTYSKIEIDSKYGDLISILDIAYRPIVLNILKTANNYLKDWINIIQNVVKDADVEDKESLENHPKTKWSKYSQLWEIDSFNRNGDNFECRIRLNSSIDPNRKILSFNNNDVPANFVI